MIKRIKNKEYELDVYASGGEAKIVSKNVYELCSAW